jgi:peptide subunit release factor 1 (eRF1)
LIRPLTHIAEDYATYAVLAVDQEVAELSYFTQGVRDAKVRLESTLYPRHQKQGALNQARYQRRAGERSAAFARAISEQIEHALTEFDFDVLIPVGSKVFIDELYGEFSEPVKTRLTESVALHLNPWPSALELAEATGATDVAAERAREGAAVAEVRELMGQNQAVTGTVDVLNALQNHQLWKLVMNEDFAATGWADPTLPIYGVGDVPTEHPLGGDVANIIAVDLAEAIVRLTLQTGGTVELVHVDVPMGADEGVPARGSEIPRTEPAALLDEVGGIGAVLRYTT